VRRARIGFSLMTHCICHERGTRFNAVPGSTPNSNKLHMHDFQANTVTDSPHTAIQKFCGGPVMKF
jgi:hypothetical protein